MKKIVLMGAAVTVTVGILVAPSLAKELSVDAILKSHVKAMGGADAMEAIKTVRRSGSASMDGVFGQMEGTNEEVIVVGKKAYQHTDLGGYAETSAWNGKTGWSKNSMEGLQDVEGEDLEMLESQAEISMLASIWRAYGNLAFERLPNDTYEGQEYVVLQVVETDLKFYLDSDTYLLAAMSMSMEDPELGEGELWIISEDYSEYEGVMFPDKMTIDIVDSMIVIETEYAETTINGSVDESIFEKPKK